MNLVIDFSGQTDKPSFLPSSGQDIPPSPLRLSRPRPASRKHRPRPLISCPRPGVMGDTAPANSLPRLGCPAFRQRAWRVVVLAALVVALVVPWWVGLVYRTRTRLAHCVHIAFSLESDTNRNPHDCTCLTHRFLTGSSLRSMKAILLHLNPE